MAGNDMLVQHLTVLISELKESVTSQIDQVLEKIEKHQEENKKLHDTIQTLSTEVDKHTKELTELRSQITLTKSPPHLQAPVVNNQPLTSQNNVMPSDRGIRRNNLIITGIELGSEDPKIFLQGFIAARFSTRSDGILAVQKINIDTTTSQTQPIHAPILSITKLVQYVCRKRGSQRIVIFLYYNLMDTT